MKLFTVMLVQLLVALPLRPLSAQWSNDPTVNNAICTAVNHQEMPQIVSDGAGGAIITWYDLRSYPPLSYDIYAQRISSAGVVQWTADGVPICTAVNNPYPTYPTIASDGAGGAIITWQDYRDSTDYNIYAQRIGSNGVVQWATNGVAICTFTHNQVHPQIVSDGSGGAVITWADLRNGTDNDIYAQRINSSGVTQWTVVGGVPICVATNDQNNPKIAGDGAGGAIITWVDYRNNNYDIYAQYIDNAGVVHMGTNGVAICTATNGQQYPNIVRDDSGGAIITWEDLRNGTDYNIYAQHIDVLGNVYWGTDGTAICSAAKNQLYPTLVSDGSGGAIITWEDQRNSYPDADIYAQHIDISGNVHWGTDGTAICTHASDQNTPVIAGDGSGGAIITWDDFRNGGNYDIYAQDINNAGAVQWTTDGAAVCTNGGTQSYYTLVSDGAGGAIITWQDSRNGSNDIYASRVFSNGTLTGIDDRATNGQQPRQMRLYQNYPNPFNPTTTITYSLKTAGPVKLRVYDVLGGLVTTLVNEQQRAGMHVIRFNASRLPSGVYFYRISTSGFSQTKKLLLLK